MKAGPERPSLEILTVAVAGEEHGFPLSRVREVSLPGHVTRVPGCPDALRGVTALRGEILPVVDLALRLGLRRRTASGRATLVIVELAAGGAAALLVDGPGRLLRLGPDDVRDARWPGRTGAEELVAGFADVGDALVPLLDLDTLLSPQRLWSAAAAPRAEGSRPAPDAPGPRAADDAPPTSPAHVTVAPERRSEGARTSPLARDAPPARHVSPARNAPPARIVASRPPAAALARPRGPADAALGRAAPSAPPAAPLAPPRTVDVSPAPIARAVARSSPAPRGSPRASSPSRAAPLVIVAILAAAILWVALPTARGVARPAPERVASREPRSESAPSATERPRVEVAPPPTEPSRVKVAPPPAERPRSDGAPSTPVERTGGADRVDGGDAAPWYEVRRGDTLWKISERCYGHPSLWPAIFRRNRDELLDPDVILPRQRLVIPPSASGSPRAEPAGDAAACRTHR